MILPTREETKQELLTASAKIRNAVAEYQDGVVVSACLMVVGLTIFGANRERHAGLLKLVRETYAGLEKTVGKLSR